MPVNIKIYSCAGKKKMYSVTNKRKLRAIAAIKIIMYTRSVYRKKRSKIKGKWM